MEAAHAFPPAMANEMLGMGTWRLKGTVDPCIEFLVQRLEGTWRELCLDGGWLAQPRSGRGRGGGGAGGAGGGGQQQGEVRRAAPRGRAGLPTGASSPPQE